jgi:Poly(A) polymerase catalytic subunit
MKEKNVCKDLTFNDCELAILRMAVDKAEEKMAKRIVNSDDIKRIIHIVENFIKIKNLICYGGTAINNILPEEDQFYNKELEVPDYDFFSVDALEDARELADLYYKEGFTDVEAKSGQHHGTYKVYVNYIPVADITYLPKEIYNALKQDAIQVGGIFYTPPNYLRMSMYLELSRPAGDISRWEKVMKRLTLLNKHYPITDINCSQIEFQRDMSVPDFEEKIYDNIRNTFVNQGVVFFGGYALSLYSQYMPKNQRHKVEKLPDFDVLSNDPETTAQIVKERLKDIGIKNVKIEKREPIGEVIPLHYEITIGKDSVAFIYKPIACHSYNNIKIAGQKVKIATIDTMLSFYLAFLYANKPYYNSYLERILCMSKFLFEVQQKNRLAQKGLLRRFSVTCYGHQESVEEIRAHKAEKYRELKKSENKKEFEEWFLNYKPDENKSKINKEIKEKKEKKKKNGKKKANKKTKKKGILGLYGGKTCKKYY